MGPTTDFWPAAPGWTVTISYERPEDHPHKGWSIEEFSLVGWIRIWEPLMEEWIVEPAIYDNGLLLAASQNIPDSCHNRMLKVERE
jgi:hypothetical protein